nr:hypothetical protein [Tanacetum cinerariifolium]
MTLKHGVLYNINAGPKEANTSAGTRDNINARNSEMEAEYAQEYFVLPLWSSYTSTVKSSEAKNGNEKLIGDTDSKANEEPDLLLQAGAARDSSGNYVNTGSIIVNTASTPVNTASPLRNVSVVRPSYPDLSTYANQDDSQIPSLEDIYEVLNDGIFTSASYDDEGAVADFTNLESTMNISPVPQSKIYSIHPKTQILRDPTSPVQTKRKVNKSSGAHAFLKFKTQQVWILVDLPFGKKGHRQKERIDYDEVFTPVARIEAIKIFLAFASYMGFIVYQMDVKSAFLYRKINEEVYVSQPQGFIDPKFPKKVYKVIKALYGLHQAPRAWYATLSTFLVKSGYRRGLIDKTLFKKKDKKDIMLVQVYVDDIIFGSTKKSWFEALIKSRFQISSMVNSLSLLDYRSSRENMEFSCQDKYVEKIMKKFNFMSVKTVSTLIETKKPLVKDAEAANVDVHLYRSMIGSLMYLTASIPDIMYVACACSRFQVTPNTLHLHAVKRIFRYLKGQQKLGLWYPRESAFDLEAYLDSDYTGVNLDRKSTTGGCQFLGRRLISWQCKKQTIVATSSIEAKYVAAASCYGQVLWIQNQIKELASPKQMTLGKDFLNLRMADSLPKTIWLSMHHVIKIKH